MEDSRIHRSPGIGASVFATALIFGAASIAEARQAPAVAQLAASPSNPVATTPASPSTSDAPPALPPSPREAALEARIQQLEAIVRRIQGQLPDQTPPGSQGGSGLAPSEPGVSTVPGAAEGGAGPQAQSTSATGGLGVPGQSLPPNPMPNGRFNSPATLEDKAAKVRFGPGFEIATDDDEFIMQFHDLTQIDYRGYSQGNQLPVHDSFGIPRQWWMTSGHITKEFGYFVSFQNGLDSISGLDMFIDFNYDKRLQIRVGRFKTPFTYEFFVEPVQALIVPERSLFFNNFGQNRDVGIMAYGQLFNGPDFQSPPKVQYAAGIFNGNRNGYVANQDGKFGSAFVNFHPFGDHPDSILENFNLGGSAFFGDNAQALSPATLRTIQATSGNAAFGTPFLSLNRAFRQQGPMAFWDLHTAWFYQQLALIAEWQSGYQDYAKNTDASTRSQHIRPPVESFYVEAGYLLTGETRSSVGIVKPSHPFSLRPDKRGWGAWEAFARYNYLDVGSGIYRFGLADRAGNANRVWMSDVGITWHMSQYVKMFLDWNHAEFNNPVTYNTQTRATQNTSNTFWWRLQLYF